MPSLSPGRSRLGSYLRNGRLFGSVLGGGGFNPEKMPPPRPHTHLVIYMTILVKHGTSACERDEHMNQKGGGKLKKRARMSASQCGFAPSRALKQGT